MEDQSTINKTSRRPAVIIVILALLLIILEVSSHFESSSSSLERLELAARDTAFRLRGRTEPNENIVIVAIDDDSLSWVNERWPWSRARIAEIVNWLNDAGAKVIALDIFLVDPSPDPADDQALVDALRDANASVTVNQIFSDQFRTTHEVPQDYFQEVLSGFGITEVVRDDDAIVRSVKAYKTATGIEGEKTYFHWAFEVVKAYLGIDAPRITDASATSITFNGGQVPLTPDGAVLVNYAGPARTYDTYSAAFVPLGDYSPEVFKDKIVFIGATSVTLQDLYPTPYSAVSLTPGVEIVANTVATLMAGDFMHIAPPWTTLTLILIFALVAWGITRIIQPTLAFGLMLTAMVVYLVIRQVVFIQTGWQYAIVTPLLMLFLGVIIPTLEQAVAQEVEKRRVRGLFSRFISPEMVSQLIETQDINSLNKRTELTILFSDIRNFTTLAEKLKPEEVVGLLNPYLSEMTEIIHRHGGTVDKYEGDAIVAFFGEPIPHPDHAVRAARAAVEMRKALQELTSKWRTEGQYTDTFEMGIGLNTGEVFVGLIGSEQRVNYTIIGDAANLAARVQDQTKEYNTPVLLTESTYEQIKHEFTADFVEAKLLKGKTEPVRMYKLIL